MMRKLWRAFLPTMILSGFCLVPATAHASSPGWIVVCGLAKSLPDDPIVYPGKPGASHLHDFLGNTSINAASTYRSMRLGGTTCPVGDTAGYWVPALYKNGRKVDPRGLRRDGRPTRNTFYYRADNVSSAYKASHPVQPFPADFRIIAGNGHATSVAAQPKLGKEIYWGCSDNSTGKLKAPPNCSTGAVSLHVGFPNCWNGVKDPKNDTPNVVYPSSYECPSTHPRVLPRVIFRLEYPVGTTSAGITLSSGPSYTIHADFWNTWDQAKLRSLVSGCLNAGEDCGTFSGSGSEGTMSTSALTLGAGTTVPLTESSGSARAPAADSQREKPSAIEGSSQFGASTSGQITGAAPSSANLPETGARPANLVLLAVSLLGIGVAMLVCARSSPRSRYR
jgi:hypothetical protein